MKIQTEVGKRKAVGPYSNHYDHGMVTIVQNKEDMDDKLWICMDCGYVTNDMRELRHEECDRDKNPINRTWREKINWRDKI